MNHLDLKTLAIFGMASMTVLATGCAQNVGDINRVQPNYSAKKDFGGVWYIRQTLTDVPATMGGVFVGVSSEMEKVRWEVQEDYLIAYRAYEYIPGYDQDAGDKIDGETQVKPGQTEGRDPSLYKEAPIAIFPIRSHFDIVRSYNTATGEQSNVLVENAFDRPWHERDFMRVEWSRNLVDSSFLVDFVQGVSGASYFVQANEGGADAFYEEHRKNEKGQKELAYFDYVTKMSLNPGAACAYGLSCLPGDVKVRFSFSRLPEYERDYEPAYYDDDMMTKFGYFRTERNVYDRKFGFLDKKMQRLANRHDIWKNDFKRDVVTGDYIRDAEGRRIPVPMAQREPKPIVYHLSPNYPEEMTPGAEAVVKDWERAFRRTVAAVKGVSEEKILEDYGPMFVLCKSRYEQEPTGYEAVCDVRPEAARYKNGSYIPFEARSGDLRLSYLYWVHQPQAAGPLGYGPSFADPETGEVVSGTAYVYGAAIDTYAQSAINQIRYANGDFSEEEIREGADVEQFIAKNYDRASADPRARGTGPSAKLADISAADAEDVLIDAKGKQLFSLFEKNGFDALRGDPNYRQRQIDKLKAAGYDQLMLDDEVVRGLAQQMGPDFKKSFNPNDITGDMLQQILKEQNPLDMEKRIKTDKARLDFASRHNVYLAEFADNAIMGTAKKYKGRKDYEQIWVEIRNEIFRAVMAHEAGHTLGLRHNFQGSFDSVNYFDQYWELKKESFKSPSNLLDFYKSNEMTPGQIDGDMTRYQYSTIMDYHSRFNSDWSGIGKYDEAAILFAYSFGTYRDLDASNTEPIPAEAGFVEILTDIPMGVGRENMQAFDDRFAPSQHPLENLHYTTFIEQLGGPEAIKKRDVMRLPELEALREQNPVGSAGRPVENHYMFCSDEWAGSLISCSRWDLGADPLEIVQHTITNYYEYYPMTHFRRGRQSFNSFSAANRAVRSFETMPFVYQMWFFDRYYGGDQTMKTYYQLAAFAGLNFLKDVATMPYYGAYQEQDGEYRLASLNPDAQGDGVALRVYPGEGRRQYTRFDTTRGYYYWAYPAEAGHFWESYIALNTLASTSLTTLLGQDVQADALSYRIPFTLYFDDQLTTLFDGFFMRDNESIAPRVANGRLLNNPLAPLSATSNNTRFTFDPLTGEELEANMLNASKPVDIRVNFNQRIWSILNGLIAFNANYQRTFVDQARVFKVGNGEQITPGPNHEIVQFTDTNSGITYGAIRPRNNANFKGMAARMVQNGATLNTSISEKISQYNNLADKINNDTTLTAAQREALITQANGIADQINQDSFDLSNLVEDINILSSAVDIFSNPL